MLTLPSGAVTVYPRVCGGTSRRGCRPIRGWGLSPRVRGNRRPAAAPGHRGGSIPACAGEPLGCYDVGQRQGVYPRVCGGTIAFDPPAASPLGLSPRVRGNRGRNGKSRQLSGSIPACAGEPSSRLSMPARSAVYPRVCGGTCVVVDYALLCQGLSPRVRGNPGDMGRRPRRAGSIPACAGEPPIRDGRRAGQMVYPRVCGGT